MTVTHKMNMDLEGMVTIPRIEVSQWDTYTRRLRLRLFEGKIPWVIPGDAKVLICCSRTDGEQEVYDTLPNGETAWSVSGNELQLTLAPQILTVAGTVMVQACLVQGEKLLNAVAVEVHIRRAQRDTECQNGMGQEGGFFLTGVLPAPEHAKAGQYIRVLEVDGNGRVLRVEAAETETEGAMDEQLIQKAVEDYLAMNPPTGGTAGADGTGIVSIEIEEV